MARYALTIFISAFLLFQVQPLIAKFILPWFGGGPSIWTTCMLFFQVFLVMGYTYAHVLTSRLSPSRQGFVHVALVAASVALLPIEPSAQLKPVGGDDPVVSILWLLLATVGGPYFILATSGPLMQKWFSRQHSGLSPYRLYSLSNAGSLLALLSFPFLVEPSLRLETQVWTWSVTYVVFAALAIWCAVRFMKSPHAAQTAIPADKAEPFDESVAPPGAGRMLMWLGLAVMGSAMLLATTNRMCIDVATIPLLWVLPLALYLVTFIICFDNPAWYDRRVYGLLLVISAAAACTQLWVGLDTSIPVLVSVYSGIMFACCMTCHGELVRLRPHPRYLTLFYLLVSVGGALGGVLVAVAAPLLFTGFWEYHLAVFGACAMTLTAWAMSETKRERTLPDLWMATLLSAGQIALTWYLLTQRSADVMTSGELTCLFCVVAVIHLLNWLTTSRNEGRGRFLIVLWCGITLVHVSWCVGFTLWRSDGSPIASSLVFTVAGSVAAAVVAVVLRWLVATRMSETVQRFLLRIAVQLALVGALTGLFLEHFITSNDLIVLACLHFGLGTVRYLQIRHSDMAESNSSPWMWASALTACTLLGTQLYNDIKTDDKFIYSSRNFYGVLHVSQGEDENGLYYSLKHGQIEHGNQYADTLAGLEPTTYYGQGTGVELAVRLHPRRSAKDPADRTLRIGLIGLGAGTMAAHGRPGDTLRFYEINRDVVSVANEYFTYLNDTAANVELALGDARISLEHELAETGSQQYDVLVVDAFSSDAIPIHLITRECADLYRQHLTDDGLLLIHISNRYLDLEPVTNGIAQHLQRELIRVDNKGNDELGVYSATWMIITSNQEFLADAEVQAADSWWADSQSLLWTDDFASLWQVISY